MTSVAVIGLGIMGRGIATNLLKHGHAVTVWNRSTTPVEQLAAMGAVPADSPASAARTAEVVFEVTADDTSSRAVWLGEQGILAGAQPDSVLVTAATLSTAWVAELAAACDRHGATFLDVPVTGGSVGAQTGNLVLLVGGDATRYATAQPVLEPVFAAIARQVIRFGPAGAGTRFKLVLNAVQAIHLAAFGEALRIATAAGLDAEQVAAALVDRPGGVITELARHGYPVPTTPANFSASWARKDLQYAAAMAGQVEHPLLASVLAAFDRAIAEGRAAEDWTTVNRPL